MLPSITKKKKKQSTYNVTLECGRATTVGLEKQEVLNILKVCVCSFRYPARKVFSYVAYIVLQNFYAFSYKYTIKKLNLQCVFSFSLQHF